VDPLSELPGKSSRKVDFYGKNKQPVVGDVVTEALLKKYLAGWKPEQVDPRQKLLCLLSGSTGSVLLYQKCNGLGGGGCKSGSTAEVAVFIWPLKQVRAILSKM
jgi:hypothetical protein